MNRRLMALAAAVSLLGLTGVVQAEEASGNPPKKVKPEEVKTWTMQADGKQWSVRPATPNYFGDTGLFHLSSAYTLEKGKAAVSFFRDNLDRDPKDVDVSIHGLSIGYGATPRLEVFGSLGLQNRVNVDAARQSGYVNDFPFAGTDRVSPGWQTGVGDVTVGAKYKFLDDYQGDGVGLAVRGFVKLPTADEAKGLGTGKPSFGASLILSKTLNYGADLHANLGYKVNSDPDSIDIGNALQWGVGLNVPACRMFQLQAELRGESYSGGDFDQTSPVDLVIGPVVYLKPGFFIRPAVSWNLAFDDRGLGSSSSSSMGRQISIGYHPGTRCCEVEPPPPPPPPPPANKPPTVALDCVPAEILAGELSRCRASASDPDGDPLTYTWSVDTGKVAGSGAEASYDSAGVGCGTTSTVTVTVSDGRGGQASATDTVRVKCPEKKPEAIACTSGGFPRNLARLNNVDKACLDDVASRMRQDPKARVIVIGHADAKERVPEVTGRKRAEAVKAYLVKDRGVDEARISVRSAAASKPIDSGTSVAARAKNRRVEIVFVPEGATAPEDE